MATNRRKFLKQAGLAGLGISGGGLMNGLASENQHYEEPKNNFSNTHMEGNKFNEGESIIGLYGEWANSLNKDKLPAYSYRRTEWTDLPAWKNAAKQRLLERLAIPAIGGIPKIIVKNRHSFDGLDIEEISWQLPYGRPTKGIVLKPSNAKGRLPGILAFHDHSGNKIFGCEKITRIQGQDEMMKDHQRDYYSNMAWANEIAKRGYVVLVPDAFTFGSRRVMLKDVPVALRKGLDDPDTKDITGINAYNKWAGDHEHIMAKSLFCAGTTWPGVFFAEDKIAIDILCAREDVDAARIGCGGLSGGGLRTVLMAGLDTRIKCAVDVGFMSTWKDFLLNKSYTHTWMLYVPLLPNELEFPEILGLRVPLPTLVLNDSDDTLYTLPEMQQAEKILKEVYRKANAEDHFKCSYYPGPHKFDASMQQEAFNWFDRWLKT
jgi:dienelactone hydrolase